MSEGRLLVIEDDPPSRVMIARGLARYGYTVEAVADALAAQARLRIADSGAYDGALVDLRLPNMDGFEFINWLHGADPAIGCILMSAQLDDAMDDHQAHPSLLFRMGKPISFPVLDEALRQVVAFTRAHRQTEAPRRAAG